MAEDDVSGGVLPTYPPPRFSGKPEEDGPALVEYVYQLFNVVKAQNAEIERVASFDSDSFDVSSLPDPAQATVGSAQQTANEAYALAAAAKSRLDNSGIDDWLEGTFTLSGTNTTVDVTFSEAQPDTDYQVICQPIGFTGSPALEGAIPVKITKATDKFAVEVSTAPGSGTSFSYIYWLRRR